MSIFEAYNGEFTSLSADISKSIIEFKANSSGEKSKGIGRHVEALLAQASDLVKQMEVEVRSHDASTRKVLSDKVAGACDFFPL
jgi:vesicle transport through interaction with t-SNAREs 1